MLNNSQLTANDLKKQFVQHKQDDSVNDEHLRLALNEFYSIVGRLEREHAPEKNRKTRKIDEIDETGLDLSAISDLGSLDVLLFESEKKVANFVPKRFMGSQKRGYYFEGNRLFLTYESSEPFWLTYPKKTPRILANEDLSTHILQIDQDLEKALYHYLQTVFFDGEYQLNLRDDAEAKAIEEISRYFDQSLTLRGQ